MVRLIKIFTFILFTFWFSATCFGARTDLLIRYEHGNGLRVDQSDSTLKSMTGHVIMTWVEWLAAVNLGLSQFKVVLKNWNIIPYQWSPNAWNNKIDCLGYDICYSYNSEKFYIKNDEIKWIWTNTYSKTVNLSWKKVVNLEYSTVSWVYNMVIWTVDNDEIKVYRINTSWVFVSFNLAIPSWYRLHSFTYNTYTFFFQNWTATMKRYWIGTAITTDWDIVNSCSPAQISNTVLWAWSLYNSNNTSVYMSTSLLWKTSTWLWCLANNTSYSSNQFSEWPVWWIRIDYYSNMTWSSINTEWKICVWNLYKTTISWTPWYWAEVCTWEPVLSKLYWNYVPPVIPTWVWTVVDNALSGANLVLSWTINRWMDMMFCWISWTYTWANSAEQICSECTTEEAAKYCTQCVKNWISLTKYQTVLTNCEVELEKSTKTTEEFVLQWRAINWVIISYEPEDIESCTVFNQTEQCMDYISDWIWLVSSYDLMTCTITNSINSLIFSLWTIYDISWVFFYAQKENIEPTDAITFRESIKTWMVTTFRVIDIIWASVMVWFIFMIFYNLTKKND